MLSEELVPKSLSRPNSHLPLVPELGLQDQACCETASKDTTAYLKAAYNLTVCVIKGTMNGAKVNDAAEYCIVWYFNHMD